MAWCGGGRAKVGFFAGHIGGDVEVDWSCWLLRKGGGDWEDRWKIDQEEMKTNP